MTNSDIMQVKKMLQALLKSEGLVEWVGGYVYGATSNDDPFIILYPAAEHLKEKVCRVYPHQFKKLPAFIATDNIVGNTDNNPSKDKAQRAGIYHECQPFQVVMHLGRETQMGREKRFSDVLYVSQQQGQPAPAPAPAPAPQPAPAKRNGAQRMMAGNAPASVAAAGDGPNKRQEALAARGLTEFAIAAAGVVGAGTGDVVKFLIASFNDTDYWPFDPQHNNRYLNAVVDGMADSVAAKV